MAVRWQDFIDGLKDDLSILAKDELKHLIINAKKDSEAFIKRQGNKIEFYIAQLANKRINKRQFEGYILDIRDLTKLQARKMKVRAKARAQRFAANVQTLIIDRLLKLI
jgi:hypothetical protein